MKETTGDNLWIAVKDMNTGETGYMKSTELAKNIAEVIFEVLDDEKEGKYD